MGCSGGCFYSEKPENNTGNMHRCVHNGHLFEENKYRNACCKYCKASTTVLCNRVVVKTLTGSRQNWQLVLYWASWKLPSNSVLMQALNSPIRNVSWHFVFLHWCLSCWISNLIVRLGIVHNLKFMALSVISHNTMFTKDCSAVYFSVDSQVL